MFVRSSEAGAAKELLVSARRHGGRLAAARRAFPAAPAPWIDLSTGINPHPWRGVSPRHDGDTARLPDPTETVELERIAATAFGCLPENIAAVPGADIGLRLLPRLIRARDVAIVVLARNVFLDRGLKMADIAGRNVPALGVVFADAHGKWRMVIHHHQHLLRRRSRG